MKTSPIGSPRNQLAHVLFAWLIAVAPVAANDLPPGSYLNSTGNEGGQSATGSSSQPSQSIPGLQPLADYPQPQANQQQPYSGYAQYQQPSAAPQASSGQWSQPNQPNQWNGQTQNASMTAPQTGQSDWQQPSRANSSYGGAPSSGYANGYATQTSQGNSYQNSQPYYGQAQQSYTPPSNSTSTYQQPTAPFSGGAWQGSQPTVAETKTAKHSHSHTYSGNADDGSGHEVLGKVAGTVLPVAGTIVAAGLVSKMMTGSYNPMRSMGYGMPRMSPYGYGNPMMGGYGMGGYGNPMGMMGGGYGNPMGMMANPLMRMGGMGSMLHF
jgi:hypothetical protein